MGNKIKAKNIDSEMTTDIELSQAIASKQDVLGFTPENIVNKNQPGGYAGLDSGGKILPSLLPLSSESINASIVEIDANQTLTSKTIDADNNTISNLEVDNFKLGVLNTSSDLVGASNTQIPSALSAKTYTDSAITNINQGFISYPLSNNQSTATNINTFILSNTYAYQKFEYFISIKTNTTSTVQAGQLRFLYNSTTNQWFISDDYFGQNAGVEFSVDSTGQVKYTSTNVTGANYIASLKISSIKRIVL
jgi:hypothetical protein